MIYKMNKPSENMLLSATQLNDLYHKQQAELYKNEEDKILAKQAEEERERNRYLEDRRQYELDQLNSISSRNEKLEKVKESFVASCLYRLYSESVGFPMTKRDKVVAKNLINNFIVENGAGNLINSFATKNMILSEFSRICDKYYNAVIESLNSSNENKDLHNQIIDQSTVDNFYKELEDIDIADASKMIKDRVADAISDFIDSNAANKLEYEEIIKQAQDRAAVVKNDDALAESYIEMAKSKINQIKATREKNVFGCMVESLTGTVFKDDNFRKRYIHEGVVDMEGIVDSAQLIYTMLEMVNTTNMVNVDEESIREYLTNL